MGIEEEEKVPNPVARPMLTYSELQMTFMQSKPDTYQPCVSVASSNSENSLSSSDSAKSELEASDSSVLSK